MSSEEDNENAWNAFYDKFGCEPKSANLLLNFIRSNNIQTTLNYKACKAVWAEYKGKGRISHKLQDSIQDLVQQLPSKDQRLASNQNILMLVSIFQKTMLVDGYVRTMHATLDFIIPQIISQLVLGFCHLQQIAVLITPTRNLCIADLTNQRRWTGRVVSSHDHQQLWSMSSGIVYQPSIRVPQHMRGAYPQLKHTADFIFQTQQTYSQALLFDVQQTDDDPLCSDAFDVYVHELPIIHEHREFVGNCLLFSEQFGLISIGGGSLARPSAAVYRLPWHDQPSEGGDKPWQWQTLSPLQFERSQCTAVVVEQSQMMVIAGATRSLEMRGLYDCSYNNLRSCVELYDLQSMQAKTLAPLYKPRMAAGSFYDQTVKNRVYVGGGQVAGTWQQNQTSYVEWYDTHKNAWYASIPRPQCMHPHFPNLWTQNNGEVLLIASLDSNVCEYIDLRVYRGKWTTMSIPDGHGNSTTQSLQKLFDMEMHMPRRRYAHAHTQHSGLQSRLLR